MFCTTTTPFRIEDAVETLDKPATFVEAAWRLLQAEFGTQVVFGSGRAEPAPNFYDVVAMAILIAVLTKPMDVQLAKRLAIALSDEISLVLESSESEDAFSLHMQFCVLTEVHGFLDQNPICLQSKLDSKRKHDISASISSIFKHMRNSSAFGPCRQNLTAVSTSNWTLG